MFGFLKNKKKAEVHNCNFTKIIGWYYTEYISEYTNSLDVVYVYKRVECDCGKYYRDVLVCNKKFRPSVYNICNDDKENYIKSIIEKGVEDYLAFHMKFN